MILTLVISLLLLLQGGPVLAEETPDQVGGDEINVAEIIFEHIGDEYEWHIDLVTPDLIGGLLCQIGRASCRERVYDSV